MHVLSYVWKNYMDEIICKVLMFLQKHRLSSTASTYSKGEQNQQSPSSSRKSLARGECRPRIKSGFFGHPSLAKGA